VKELKALFVTRDGDDYVASCLWDGLRCVLGAENVADASMSKSLISHEGACSRIVNKVNPVFRIPEKDEQFDVAVVNACYGHDRSEGWLRDVLGRHLKTDGKIAWVDGGDSPHEDYGSVRADAYFKREIDPGNDYSQPWRPMLMGVPEHWLGTVDLVRKRTYDFFCVFTASAHPTRWKCLRALWETSGHTSIAASGAICSPSEHAAYLRNSSFCVCPPGAGSDCLRQWEAAAAGAIPVFVGHPPRVRDPWFGDGQVIELVTASFLSSLPPLLAGGDVSEMRHRLHAQVLNYHTTRRRAELLLRGLGFTATK
jgi:hypothetical protein